METRQAFDSYLIVKTVETHIGRTGGRKTVIKTLRLYDCNHHYHIMDELLLEQINSWTFNEKVQQNHTFILQNGFKLYFFRRERDQPNKGRDDDGN